MKPQMITFYHTNFLLAYLSCSSKTIKSLKKKNGEVISNAYERKKGQMSPATILFHILSKISCSKMAVLEICSLHKQKGKNYDKKTQI